jgi:GH15 family glucan-1,4-alpha-glucosidase
MDAIQEELGCGSFHYRYSGAEKEEDCFLACTFWLAEAQAILGDHARGAATFAQAVEALDVGTGIYSEMVNAETKQYLGNMPQALTHLALIGAAGILSGCEPDR